MQQRQRHDSYRTPDGQRVSLGNRIAQGGEGTVHDIKGNPGLVVKVYKRDRRPPWIDEKLRQMINNPPGGQPPATVAWPLARLLSDRNGATSGYIMRKAASGAIPAVVFTSVKLRKQHREMAGKCRRDTQALMARIVAAYADTMQALHDAGYAIGDVNDKNLLAWPDGRILILDADSFQVPDNGGGYHRCRVGRPEYQPPEILNRMSPPCRISGCPEGPSVHQVGYGCFDRKPDHDRFSLGVLAYQALCDGRHPYSGRLTEIAEAAEKSVDRIRLGYFPFHSHGERHIQPSLDQKLEWEALTPELKEYFRQTFQHSV